MFPCIVQSHSDCPVLAFQVSTGSCKSSLKQVKVSSILARWALHSPHSSTGLCQRLPVANPKWDQSWFCLASSGKATVQPPEHTSCPYGLAPQSGNLPLGKAALVLPHFIPVTGLLQNLSIHLFSTTHYTPSHGSSLSIPEPNSRLPSSMPWLFASGSLAPQLPKQEPNPACTVVWHNSCWALTFGYRQHCFLPRRKSCVGSPLCVNGSTDTACKLFRTFEMH